MINTLGPTGYLIELREARDMYRIVDINTIFGFWPLREIDISVSRLMKLAQQHNIENMCSLSAKGIFYDFEQGNDETLAISKRYKEIIPVATINLRKFCDYRKEVKKRVSQGFKIYRLFPDFQGWSIDYAPFNEFLKILTEFNLPLIISVSGGTVTQIARMVKGHNLPIILIGDYTMITEMITVVKENPNLYIETHRITTPRGIETIANTVGAEQLVFGSESPLSYAASALGLIKSAELTSGQKELILGGNIRRILRIK